MRFAVIAHRIFFVRGKPTEAICPIDRNKMYKANEILDIGIYQAALAH